MVDVEVFGGRRGYIGHLYARALYALGSYRSTDNISWDAISRLVFVCHGNICRSPYACARARELGVNSISFGLAAADGALADESASRNALLRGVDLSTHRSVRLRAPLLNHGDLVVVFEPRQLAKVFRESVVDLAGITLMGIWDRPVYPHIQDPFGRSDRYFQRCFSAIDRNIDVLATRIAAYEAPAIDSGAFGGAGSVSLQQRLSVRRLIP